MATIPIVAAVKDFDRLTRELAASKEQAKLARAEAKGLKDTLEDTAKGGALKDMAKRAGEFAVGMLGVNSASAIAGKLIAAAKDDFAQLVAMQKGAAAAQQTMYEATGSLAQSSNLTPKQVDDWRVFAERQGAQLGEGGAVGVIQARAALGGEMAGTSETVKQEAMARAITAKAQNPALDMTRYFTTLMEMQDAVGGNVQTANNMVIAATQSGMKLESLAKNIDMYKALSAETGVPLEQVMAKGAILGTEMGEEGAGTLRKLLMGGKGGNDASKIGLAKGVLKRSAEEQAAIEERFAAGAMPGADFGAEIGQTMAVVPGAPGILATKGAEGEAGTAKRGSTRAAEWDNVRKRLASFKTKYEITTGFDFANAGADWAANKRDEDPLEYERQQKARLLKRELPNWQLGRAPGESRLRLDPYAGMSEEQMLQANAMNGGISARGGINAVESASLAAVGVTPETIAAMMKLDREALAAAIVEALRNANQPGANALNPGT